MLNRLRDILDPLINKIGLSAAKIGFSANGWTVIGLVFAAFSALFYSEILFGNGFYGGSFLLLSGFVDIIDGAVARVTKSVSSRGNFLDSTFDRVGEILVFLGITSSGIGDCPIIFLALSFSLLVSYLRAKGEALQVKVAGLGVGERA